MRTFIPFVIFLFAAQISLAQNTVGLISYKPWKSYDGYNIMYPHNQPNVYLLNNCGEVVHTWAGEEDIRPGNTAYLREDGSLVKTQRPAGVAGNPIWAGGGGGTVEIRSWNNDLLWSFTQNDSLQRLHHDIQTMPNGNILMVSWELKSREESIQAGRDTSILAQDKLWPDYILEVNPDTDETVWEWHAWDHLIQDFDATKSNFGVVADHPEKININWDTNDGHPDWMHTNAIDYIFDDELGLDHVLISVPQFNEVWVIDHSTTTAEAAGSTGGFSGRGGDLIYRWGNPAAYNKGDSTDQTLYYPHDIQWVDSYIDESNPHYRKFAAFNNRIGADFSAVTFWTSPWDMYDASYAMDEGIFMPFTEDFNIFHPEPTAMWSTGLSSVQVLPNGNFLICSGRFGYSFEITPADEIVWEYKTPLVGGQPASQGDTLAINNNLTFRLNRIPLDYPAFDGKDLSPKGWIELNPDSLLCDLALPTIDIAPSYDLKIFPNPTQGHLTIEWNFIGAVNLEVYDHLGRLREVMTGMGGRKYCMLDEYESGIYFIRINGVESRKFVIY